jgi:hypothetical protein
MGLTTSLTRMQWFIYILNISPPNSTKIYTFCALKDNLLFKYFTIINNIL